MLTEVVDRLMEGLTGGPEVELRGASLRQIAELIELARGPEGVKNERNKAEDEEVGGMWGGPAPQKYIEADAEIDQGDEAEPLMDAAVLHVEDDGDIGQADTIALEAVVDGVVGSGAPDFAGEVSADQSRLVAGGDEKIAWFDAGALAGTIGGNPLSFEAAAWVRLSPATSWSNRCTMALSTSEAVCFGCTS